MLDGKVCVVTGATAGIGRAAARAMVEAGAHVELLGRNARRGGDLLRELNSRRKMGSARFHPVDLAHRGDVERVADVIARLHPRIDVLINNAGARYDRYAAAPNGIEMTFAGNHLGHFLLTCLLLDRLIAAKQGRVITVASGSHADAGSTDRWVLSERDYDRRQAYARSKLANVMFAYGLAERTRPTRVTSNAMDPGGVASRFASNNGFAGWARHVLSHTLRREIVLPATAAAALVRLASAPELASVTGRYFRRNAETRSSPASYDAEALNRLWSLSVELSGANAAKCSSWTTVRPSSDAG